MLVQKKERIISRLGVHYRIRQNPDIRRRDAVAPGILHQVHGLIGKVQQSFLRS